MKSLVVYDSTNGNTEKIAQGIGKSIGGFCQLFEYRSLGIRETGHEDGLWIISAY